jgi:hypothetical protein
MQEALGQAKLIWKKLAADETVFVDEARQLCLEGRI